MSQKRILIPTDSESDWKSLLAEPEKQWRPGYSAMLTAQSWENAGGLPPEIESVFTKTEASYFNNLFGDYAGFISLYGATPVKDQLIFLADIDGILLFSAWVYSAPGQA